MQIEVQFAVEANALPSEKQLLRWAEASLQPDTAEGEVTIRLVDEAESAELNESYRHKTGATNVLSFPYETPELDVPLLGDLVICVPVVAQEAAAQGKPVEAHWAHMVVHGMLHLQGYDHLNDADAQEMEAEESRILAALGYDDPYQAAD
jgi:probable rRNA maturation factor